MDVASVWLPDDARLNEAEGLTGEPRAEKMRQWATQACEVDTQWCNGGIWGYRVDGYRLRREDEGEPDQDPDDDDGDVRLVMDSCGSLYGLDRGKQEMEDPLVHARQTVVPPAVFVDPAMPSTAPVAGP